MTLVYKGLGVLVGLALMVVLLFSSVEFVVYHMDGYFENEYNKYEVTKAVDVEMHDLMTVTDEMMDYLKGERKDLVIYTKIGDSVREFFNAKEKRHMADVQKLFIAAQALRLKALLFALFVMGILLFVKKSYPLLWGIQRGIGIFFVGIGILTALMLFRFNYYFTLFHEIFFSNDDWILNPKTDLLINIVPEGFFRDTAFWIAGVFGVSAFIVWSIAWFLAKRVKTGE